MNHAPVALLDNERAFSNESQALPVDSVDDEYLVVERHAARHYGLRRAFPARQKLQVRIDRAFDILYLDLPMARSGNTGLISPRSTVGIRCGCPTTIRFLFSARCMFP